MEITYPSNKLVCVLDKNNDLVFASYVLGPPLITFSPALGRRSGCCVHVTDEAPESREVLAKQSRAVLTSRPLHDKGSGLCPYCAVWYTNRAGHLALEMWLAQLGTSVFI